MTSKDAEPKLIAIPERELGAGVIEVAKNIGLDVEKFTNDLTAEATIKLFQEDLNLRRKLNVRSFPSLVLKYKKETYPIRHEYNNPQMIINQIEDLSTNVYF